VNQGDKPARKAGSKRARLKQLPRDWQDKFWRHVQNQLKLASATAVEILIGGRPVEMTERPEALGVQVAVTDDRTLTLLVTGAKVRQNTRQPHRSIIIDPERLERLRNT
jgi:hypothetical protein